MVERKDRHIVELGLTLSAQADLLFRLWWDAIHTAVYHINRLPTLVLKFVSPYKKLFKHKPNYNFLKCFGCLCYPYLRDFNKHTFDFHIRKCIFIGYIPSHKCYKCLTSSGKVHTLRHVIFYETIFPYLTNNTFSSSENISSSEIPVSSFSQQQIFYLSTLSIPDSSLEENFSADSARNEQVSSSSLHIDILHHELPNHSLTESLSPHISSQNPESIQPQSEP